MSAFPTVNDDVDSVVLQSQDGVDLKVPINVANMCKTIENLIQDAGTDLPIPLPNVTGKILTKVVEFCKHVIENPPSVAKEETKAELRTDDLTEWEKEFCNVDQTTLFEMILAANYLDIKGLLDIGCKTVANNIKGKTPDEICKHFNITKDFTPEEEEQVRKENAWCEEE